MRKGFVHIIEIVVIALLMFVIIVQLTSTPQIQNNFGRTRLTLLGNDLLFSLDGKGVNWLNGSAVKAEIDPLLDTSVVYDIEVKGAINTPLLVGCVCNDTEKAVLESLLTPFSLNRENIAFSVIKIEPPTPATCTSFNVALPLTYDVVVMFDYNLSGNIGCQSYDYEQSLQSFVGAGKGLVQIRSMDESNLEGALTGPQRNGEIYRKLFGITYNSALTPDASELVVQPDVNSTFYLPRRYVSHIPLAADDFNDNVADDFSPRSGGWGILTGLYTGSDLGQQGLKGFTEYTGPLTPNYTILYDFVVSDPATASGFWSPGYLDGTINVLAGIIPGSPPQLAITNTSFFKYDPNFVAFNSTAIPLQTPFFGNAILRKEGERVVLSVFDATGGRLYEVSFTFPEAPQPGYLQGPPGFYYEHQLSTDVFAVDNVRLRIGDDLTIGNFLSPRESVQSLDSGSAFALQPSSGAAGVVLNDTPTSTGQGRVAWISSWDSNQPAAEHTILVKSIVAWAGGDSYRVVRATIPNDAASFSLLKTITGDMFQPVEIVMRLGFVF